MSATSRTTVAVTGAAATILVARLLGPAGTGGYAIAQTLILMLILASTLGVEHGITYYVSSGQWDARAAYRSAQVVALCSGLAGALLGTAARIAVPSAFAGLSLALTALAAFSLPFALSWFYATYVALAVDRYEAYALGPAIQSTLALVLVGALTAIFGLSGAVVGYVLAHVITAVAYLRRSGQMFARPADRLSATPGPGKLRRAIHFGIKGYAANALQFLNYRLDLFILAGVAGAAQTGQYAIAVAVTSVVWLLPQSLSDVLFPRVAKLSANTLEDVEEQRAFAETKSLRHTVIVVVLSSALVALALQLLVVPVYGAAFQPAVDIGFILLPGVALIGIGGTLSATIVGRGRPGYSLIAAVIVTPVTIALYLIMIPSLHATGAALASTISYTASFLLAALFYRRATGHSLARRLVPTRSELGDYRALAPAVHRWLAGVLARRPSRA